jgi:hypothetical protein
MLSTGTVAPPVRQGRASRDAAVGLRMTYISLSSRPPVIKGLCDLEASVRHCVVE